MATATYQRTLAVGNEALEQKSVALVDVDAALVEVAYWHSLIAQWGQAGVISYLEAEALWSTGNNADARAKLSTLAVGADMRTYDEQGVQIGGADTRNWAQRWIDDHPDPIVQQTWTTDPLLD